MSTATTELYVTPKEAAHRLAVSVKLIYKLASQGELEALKVGRSVRILAASLQDFIARNTVPRPEAVEPEPEPVSPHRPAARPRSQAAGGFVFLPPRGGN